MSQGLTYCKFCNAHDQRSLTTTSTNNNEISADVKTASRSVYAIDHAVCELSGGEEWGINKDQKLE